MDERKVVVFGDFPVSMLNCWSRSLQQSTKNVIVCLHVRIQGVALQLMQLKHFVHLPALTTPTAAGPTSRAARNGFAPGILRAEMSASLGQPITLFLEKGLTPEWAGIEPKCTVTCLFDLAFAGCPFQ